MPERAINRARQVTTFIVLLGMASSAAAQATPATERDFPIAAFDYFAAMDDGTHLDSHGVRGRNTWLLWTTGDEAFWDLLATQSSGTFDLLKVIDSRDRSTRFSYYGVMNEPGFRQASAADQYGLWFDVPDGTRDPYYSARYDEAFPKDAFVRTYGRASGIVELRIFPNPNFDAAARRSGIRSDSTTIRLITAIPRSFVLIESGWPAVFAMSALIRCIRRPIRSIPNGRIFRARSARNI